MAKPKILVVDDEPDVVKLIEASLTSDGFEVLKAYDGISAIDVIENERPDLVLLDLMMPVMSGYEVCEQLKGNPVTHDIPIICLTSAHAPSVREQSVRLGAAYVIEKPFLIKELTVQIKRHLRQTQPEQ